jgi:sensor histidine kinase YesM
LNALQESPKVKGSGLLNVQKRLQHYFGSGYGIKIESKSGQGTELTIPLPKR